eukprot:CAMPEP_0194536572 /NCGR_PEP_ID=MMETSP0253-20130528/75547_1 /TAXON_ID=2966 /ORGANISM="Noctiluca scintillans" /LENGTH=44 /DNA_ID= /DNA_START= /DNA_END= /DNA_ORIENTATION=
MGDLQGPKFRNHIVRGEVQLVKGATVVLELAQDGKDWCSEGRIT